MPEPFVLAMSAMYLSENLRYLRRRHDPPLSQERVSRNLKISRSRYAHYELGDRSPPLEVLRDMANYFDVTMEELLSCPLWEKEGEENCENISRQN